MSLVHVVFTTFIVNLILSLGIGFVKSRYSERESSKELSHLLFRYFLCFEAISSGFFIQLPFRYFRYLECGLNHSQISSIISYSHISTAFWNILMPFILRLLGHSNLLLIIIICLILSSVCMCIGHYNSFIVSGLLSSISFPTLMMCLQDYWMTEELLLNIPNANYIFNEIKNIVSMFSSLLLGFISYLISFYFGTTGIFSFTPCLFAAAIIPVVLLLRVTNDNKLRKPQNDISDLLHYFRTNKLIYIVILTEITFFAGMYLVFQRFLAFLVTDNSVLPVSVISCTYNLGSLSGSYLLTFLVNRFSPILLTAIGSLLTSVLFYLIYFFYDNKSVVFLLILLIQVLNSSMLSLLMQLRKMFYPGEVRNYIMSLVKIPTSIIIFLIMHFWSTENIHEYNIISGVFFTLCFHASYILYLLTKDAKQEKSDESQDRNYSSSIIDIFSDDSYNIKYDTNSEKIE